MRYLHFRSSVQAHSYGSCLKSTSDKKTEVQSWTKAVETHPEIGLFR